MKRPVTYKSTCLHFSQGKTPPLLLLVFKPPKFLFQLSKNIQGREFCDKGVWPSQVATLQCLHILVANRNAFIDFFIYFNWGLITLQYCIGFAIHQHEATKGAHVFTILNPPSHLPSQTIPLGHPSAPAPSILHQTSNLDWRFISYMILYMFQWHSPKSAHPRPLPQSPKDCSIHLCLFCCLAYRVIITIFLNSIYMR